MRHLNDAIRKACLNSMDEFVRARTIMANAIVASMLPDGVIKGGSALKMRFGDMVTRFTTDLDTATATDPIVYAQKLDSALRDGWEGFSGHIVKKKPASPKNVPSQYVMHPFDVKLEFMGKPWCTVPLEVGDNEIGDADVIEWAELKDAAILFNKVGLPAPDRAPLMPLEHQVAQKLHALTSNSDRARDLVDLQLIMSRASIDLKTTKQICQRLFAYRKAQVWPTMLIKQAGWKDLYAQQAQGLSVLQDLDEAIKWVNVLITKIDSVQL